MAKKYYHPDSDFWRKYKMQVPETIPHGTTEDISEKMEKMMPNSWRLEGNRLIGETKMGELINIIPTDYILVGSENGLPVFRKVDISNNN